MPDPERRLRGDWERFIDTHQDTLIETDPNTVFHFSPECSGRRIASWISPGKARYEEATTFETSPMRQSPQNANGGRISSTGTFFRIIQNSPDAINTHRPQGQYIH